MQYDFSKLTASTIDGKELNNLCQLIGNAVYSYTNDLGMVDIAKGIYKGEKIELTYPQVEEVKRIIKDEKTGFFAFVQKSIIDFLDKEGVAEDKK